jgi:hypothetical protein
MVKLYDFYHLFMQIALFLSTVHRNYSQGWLPQICNPLPC